MAANENAADDVQELWQSLDRRDESLVTRILNLRAANDRLTAERDRLLRQNERLDDDAQAMALLRKFNLSVFKMEHGYSAGTGWNEEFQAVKTFNIDPARAICECVAALKEQK